MNQKGFTLVELVLVIVILGILAAFIIPRFVSLDSKTRVATVDAMKGNVLSSAMMVHTMALAENQADPTGTITSEGYMIDLAYGYPKRIAAMAGH